MKIRTGFVSNSSSSSFCIFGVALEEGWNDFKDLTEEAISLLKEKGFLCDSNNEGKDEDEDEYEDEDEDEYEDIVGESLYCLSVHFKFGYDSWYGYYIGNSWSNVQDDQTGREFKEEVKKNLSKIFKSDSKIWESLGTHEEAWHD